MVAKVQPGLLGWLQYQVALRQIQHAPVGCNRFLLPVTVDHRVEIVAVGATAVFPSLFVERLADTFQQARLEVALHQLVAEFGRASNFHLEGDCGSVRVHYVHHLRPPT